MNRISTLIAFLGMLWAFQAQSQSYQYLQDRVKKNSEIILKGKHNLFPVRTDQVGLHILERNTNRVLHTAHWSQMPKYIDALENWDYYTMVQAFKAKGTGAFVQYQPPAEAFQHYRDYPTQFEGLYVAIDPGHFGGSEEEALYERRIVNVEGKYLDSKVNTTFYEAELTYTTAIILKDSLEKLGAKVLITRGHTGGAINKTFHAWLKNGFLNDAKSSLSKEDITQAYYNELLTLYKDSVSQVSRRKLFDYYKFLDFRARIKKINDFRANVTIVLHFNASENGKMYGTERYSVPVKENYSMAFIPGAILNNELEKPDQKIDLIRLLVSPDLENSARLANLILDGHRKFLNVEPIPFDSLGSMKKVVNPTEYNGVFSRNLPLTRMVRGTVVYTESFYQDNIDMVRALGRQNFYVTDDDKIRIQTSEVVKYVAAANMYGLRSWLNGNKEITLKYSAKAGN